MLRTTKELIIRWIPQKPREVLRRISCFSVFRQRRAFGCLRRKSLIRSVVRWPEKKIWYLKTQQAVLIQRAALLLPIDSPSWSRLSAQRASPAHRVCWIWGIEVEKLKIWENSKTKQLKAKNFRERIDDAIELLSRCDKPAWWTFTVPSIAWGMANNWSWSLAHQSGRSNGAESRENGDIKMSSRWMNLSARRMFGIVCGLRPRNDQRKLCNRDRFAFVAEKSKKEMKCFWSCWH